MSVQNLVLIFLVAVLCFLIFTIYKSRSLIDTNERLAEQAGRSLELQERSVLAIERVAAALEALRDRDRSS